MSAIVNGIWTIDKATYLGTGLGTCCTYKNANYVTGTPAGYVANGLCTLKIPSKIGCANSGNSINTVQNVDVCDLAMNLWDHGFSDYSIVGVSC